MTTKTPTSSHSATGRAALERVYVPYSQICAQDRRLTTQFQVLGIALTDTFGTPAFFDAFSKLTSAPNEKPDTKSTTTYAQSYAGVRQDSGDPSNYVKMAREFYDRQGITDKKVIVFSDSLNIENCIEYKTIAEEAGFTPTFGVGTFFTSMFDMSA